MPNPWPSHGPCCQYVTLLLDASGNLVPPTSSGASFYWTYYE